MEGIVRALSVISPGRCVWETAIRRPVLDRLIVASSTIHHNEASRQQSPSYRYAVDAGTHKTCVPPLVRVSIVCVRSLGLGQQP